MITKKLLLTLLTFMTFCVAEPIKPLEFHREKDKAQSTQSSSLVSIKAEHKRGKLYCDTTYVGTGRVKLKMKADSYTLKEIIGDSTVNSMEVTIISGQQYNIRMDEHKRSRLISFGTGGVIVSDPQEGPHYHPILQTEIVQIKNRSILHGPLLLIDPLRSSWRDSKYGKPLAHYFGGYYQLEKVFFPMEKLMIGTGIKAGIGFGYDFIANRDSMDVRLYEEPEYYLDSVDTENDPYENWTIEVSKRSGSSYRNLGGVSVRILLGNKKARFQVHYFQSYGVAQYDIEFYPYEHYIGVAFAQKSDGEYVEVDKLGPDAIYSFSMSHTLSLNVTLIF